MPMQRLISVSRALARRTYTTSPAFLKGSQNSTPGWEGRHGDDHVLNRDNLDRQGEPSNQARADKAAGKEGSNAISQKDERNSNQKAKDDHPEAPGPVIGMNSGKSLEDCKMMPD